MSSITELPESVRFAVASNPASEAALWQWVSEQHYAAVVGQNREHLLVFVKEAVDFAPMEQACVGFHVYAGQAGQEPVYSIGQLCRALTVKYLNDWSYRQTESEIRSNSLVRWLVGYGLRDATLDHVTLWRFGQWVNRHAHRVFLTKR